MSRKQSSIPITVLAVLLILSAGAVFATTANSGQLTGLREAAPGEFDRMTEELARQEESGTAVYGAYTQVESTISLDTDTGSVSAAEAADTAENRGEDSSLLTEDTAREADPAEAITDNK